MTEELEGSVLKITFFNPSNYFTVARLKTNKLEAVTIVGNFPALNLGETLRLKGYWKLHEKFGNQFIVESFEFSSPESLEDIESYLCSGLIEGIKKPLAKKIVSKFGREALSVLDNEINRLHEISRIPQSKFEAIKNSWNLQRDFRKALMFLQGLGLNSSLASKLYSIYGQETEKIISENPYHLLSDISDMGFKMADQIAFKLGFTEFSYQRIDAGIIFLLRKLADEGHTYYPYEPLIREAMKLLNTDYDSVVDSIYNLTKRDLLVEEELNYPESHDFSKGIFLSELYYAETFIDYSIRRLNNSHVSIKHFNKEKALRWLEDQIKITLAEEQKKAVLAAFGNKMIVITGGPGTGKTTIINSILRLLKKYEKKTLLTAPTGRAAKRMTEATANEAKTIHRLLEYSPQGRCFGKNEDSPLETDFVIVDECSMIDTMLFSSLLKAIPHGAALVLVGDSDQLPSIGAGNILKDIIDSKVVPTFQLNEIFRQSKESMIIVNAHRINKGQMPLLYEEENEDFYFMDTSDPQRAQDTIVNLCKTVLPEQFGFDPFSDVQVLSPMHKGMVGVSNLNCELQNILNDSQEELKFGDKAFRSGDKVMQNKNNYQKDIYNGDIGRVVMIDQKKKTLDVNFDGRIVRYEFPELDELLLAYAISVHKSQGSEYPVIIMPVMQEQQVMMQRNLLYTAITRGKKIVILIGTEGMISYAVRNHRARSRYTFLKNRLISEY